jgi:RNA polymerase sigma-70 factor (ECF subfamily)
VDDDLDVDTLYRRYRGALYSLCLARLHDPSLAEDVVQDVFAKAIAVLPRFDRRRPFWPWLASIAARECVDAHRRRVLALARHEEMSAAANAATSDVTSRAALGRVAQDLMSAEIDRLPPRQRIALQLFVFDGWSYADIAERLGCSVGTVGLLILRARAKLRHARARLLGGLGTVVRGLATRMNGVFERATARMGRFDPILGRLSGADASASLAVLLTGMLGLSPAAEARAFSRATPAISVIGGTAPSMEEGRSPAAEAADEPMLWPEPIVQAHSRAVEQTLNEAAAPLVPPSGEQLEDQHPRSATVSPGYDTDRTVFVVDGQSKVWVTRDGGASWSRLRALGATPHRILLPPAYPVDSRIFSIGLGGLEVSHNRGDSFETIGRGADDAVISPGFDHGEPTILLVLAAGGLALYDDRTGAVEPVLLDEHLTDHVVIGARYDPADPHHRTIDLVSRRPLVDLTRRPTTHVNQCTWPGRSPDVLAPRPPLRLTCTTSAVLEGFHATKAQLSAPNEPSGALFVRGDSDVLVSLDRGRTFQPVARWGALWLAPNDVAAIPSMPRSAILARDSRLGEAPLLRTDDGGASWTPLDVDLPGFAPRTGSGGGAFGVVVTPTGRIIALGYHHGVACSVDGGRTWAPLCPTPDA